MGLAIQEWGFVLNKGSSINLSHDIKGTAQDTLVLAFIEGEPLGYPPDNFGI
jgi:hypothetical protein